MLFSLCFTLDGTATRKKENGDVGVVLQTMGEDVIVAGTNPQPIASCLTTLDRFLLLGMFVMGTSGLGALLGWL